jgi:hypothetical protein
MEKVKKFRNRSTEAYSSSDSDSDSSNDNDNDNNSHIQGEQSNVTEKQDNRYVVSPAKRTRCAETPEELKLQEPRVKTMINSFIMKKVFPKLKFPIEEWNAGFLVAAAEENPDLMSGQTTEPTRSFVNHYEGKVSTAFSDLRHSTQTMSRTNYLSKCLMPKTLIVWGSK